MNAHRWKKVLLFCLVDVILGTYSASAIGYRAVALTGQSAPGAGAGVLFRDVFGNSVELNNVNQTSFIATFANEGSVETKGHGVWSEGGGALRLVMSNETAPRANPTDRIDLAGNLLMNDAGQVAFATTRMPAGNLFAAFVDVWKESADAAQFVIGAESDAPELGAGVFLERFYGISSFDGSGQVGFLASVIGSNVDPTNDFGIWSERAGGWKLIAHEGAHAPGTQDGVNFFFWDRLFPLPDFNRLGQVAFRANLVGADVDPTKDRGIWSEATGNLEMVVRSGSPVPGMDDGIVFEGFGHPDINDAGQLVFGAGVIGHGIDFRNDEGIWAQNGDDLRLVARQGAAAPGTEPFTVFKQIGPFGPQINDAGETAFAATLTGLNPMLTNDTGIWSERHEVLRLVAREGDAAPGVSDGARFSGFNFVAFKMNRAGRVAFQGDLQGPSVNHTNVGGIWAENADGLQLVARWGDVFELAPGDRKIIAALDFRGFNDHDRVAFSAKFTDGTSGIFVANLSPVPEPSAFHLALVAGAAQLLRRRVISPVGNS